ncbi:MAG: hypothetical protein AMS19_00445 [Gemmatimonas sp. SG8_23]|jgi:hypothetical protein|nr:MAG: hypothetical protein AMS19_00445 [Gemmatimonas sp. SG8_23]
MTSPVRELHPKTDAPVALHDRAMDNLRYIRETMERSASFTHVSGIGGVAMGVVAFAAAGLAWTASSPAEWVTVWLVAAGVSLGVAVLFLARKSKAEGVTLLTGPARKFAWSVTPPLAAGGILTVAFVRGGVVDMLPGMWLLLYGTGIVAGGSHSVRPIPIMGATFMAVGVAALLGPSDWHTVWGNLWMAAGFGGLHVMFGAIIWRRHGG